MKNLITTLVSITVILIIFEIIKRSSIFKKRSVLESKALDHPDTDSFIDYNAVFLETFEGKDAVRIAKTYNQNDILLIQSMLHSEGINSFSEFENMNSLFPGIAIRGVSDSYIYVLEEEKDDAKIVIKNYIEEIGKSQEVKNISRIRNIAEFAVGGYAIPTYGSKMLPELLI